MIVALLLGNSLCDPLLTGVMRKYDIFYVLNLLGNRDRKWILGLLIENPSQ